MISSNWQKAALKHLYHSQRIVPFINRLSGSPYVMNEFNSQRNDNHMIGRFAGY